MDEMIIVYFRIFEGKHWKITWSEIFPKSFPGGKRWGGEICIFQNQLEIRVRELITTER